MIGGVDTTIEGLVDQEDVDLLVRILHAGWPDGVCESADGTMVMPLRSTLGRRALGKELFVYRDEASKASWDEEGFTEDNGETMISVTIADDCIALVSGEPTSVSGALVTSIQEALRWRRHTRPHSETHGATRSEQP